MTHSPGTFSKFPGILSKREPIGPQTCDECHEVITEKEESFEYGNDFICKRCWERHLDEAENWFGGDR